MKQDTMFVKKLFGRFFLPALFSSLALAVGSVADSLYVGRSIGENGLFVIGAAYPIYMVFSTLSIGMASGGAVHFAAALGEGKEKKARNIFFSTLFFDFVGIVLIVLLGLILRDPLIRLLGAEGNGEMRSYVTLMLAVSPVLFLQAPLQYFVYADGNPRLASAALVAGNLCDCAFGFLFIVVLKTGVIGSVYSTLCGAIVMECVCLVHFVRGKGALGFRNCGKPSLKIAARSFFTGFSTGAVYFYQFVTVLVINRILLNIGGEWGVAVYDVVYNLGSIVTAVTEGTSMALIALVSTFYSERNAAGIRGSLRLAGISCFALTAVLGGGLALAAPSCCFLFGISADYLQEAAYAMRLYMASMAFACLIGALGAYFQSIASEKVSYLITALRSFVLLLLFAGLFSSGGYPVFWYCFLGAEAATFAVAASVAGRRKIFREDGCSVFSETFIGKPEEISDLCERVQGFLSAQGESEKRSYFISLSAGEVFRLIAANGDTVVLQFTLIYRKGEDCVLHFRDNARHFDLTQLSEEDEIGLRIIRSKAKSFYYRPQVGFNTLTVTF